MKMWVNMAVAGVLATTLTGYATAQDKGPRQEGARDKPGVRAVQGDRGAAKRDLVQGDRGAVKRELVQGDRGGVKREGLQGDRVAKQGDTPVAKQQKVEQRVDKREANQQKRIEQGVKKGQLTTEETTKLQGLETDITSMEEKFKTDGKVTRDEAQQLKKALNDASLQIWAERHDTDGKQMAAVRLGKDIFARDELTAKIESGAMTHAQAREFLAGFKKLVNMKRRLATDSLTEEQRAKLQVEYNTLLNKFFVMK